MASDAQRLANRVVEKGKQQIRRASDSLRSEYRAVRDVANAVSGRSAGRALDEVSRRLSSRGR